MTDSLKRVSGLCKAPLATELTDSERRLEIDCLRCIIPAFILAHHDRKLQLRKPSIVPVANGVCSACHLQLLTGHVARLQSSQDLEVCDNCGTFIFLQRRSNAGSWKAQGDSGIGSLMSKRFLSLNG